MLREKTIVMGVTGGIAAYKIPEVVRRLRQSGAEVRVVMTKNAQEFVTPLTFQTVSNNPVITDMFAPFTTAEVAHISLADKADLVVVAPASANAIAKFTHGIADDFLSTMVLATKAPVLLAPAMNVNMYENPATQENLRCLRSRGVRTVGPGEGELACGWQGKGRMAEPEEIFEAIEAALSPHDLTDQKILITAGPTREPIDPVRFISNHSSGKMGYALAAAARMRGADVTLVSGPTSLAPPREVTCVFVQTALEMEAETLKRFQTVDTVIMAAAVGDYRPAERAPQKIKKGAEPHSLLLVRNPDILEEMGKNKGGVFLVGFAAETADVLTNAYKKLKAKNLDLLVANDVTTPGAGFQSDTNIVTFLFPDGSAEPLPQLRKEEVAHRILDKILALKAGRQGT